MPDHRLHHRHRIGQTRGFDHHPRERPDPACLHPVHQVGKRIHQLTAHGTAQTSVRQFDDPVTRAFHQQMVDADISELVDDQGRIG
jgi:hypothetical protein